MPREEWSSKWGFIAAALGSAIGIGNIWRFPYMMSLSGGGAFLFPYLIAVVFFGIPILLLELATGRKFRGSIITSFKNINPKLKWLSLIPIVTVFAILGYYVVVTGWTLTYFVASLYGQFLQFRTFSESIEPLIFTILTLTLTAYVVKSGVRNGIENVSKILMPILFILLVILFAKTITLPNAINGIIYYFKPDFTKIFDFKVWLLAFSQSLFSLSAGYGIMLTYGSYLNKKEDIPKLTVAVVVGDTFVAIIAGFIIFSAIYSFNLNLAEGPHLAFVVLMKVFQEISHGLLIASIFFLLLFVAGLSSAISMMEALTANLVDEMNFSREKTTVILLILLFLIAVPVSFSYAGTFSINLLEVMDYIFGTLFTLLSAAIICFVIAWYWDPKSLIREFHMDIHFKIEKIEKISKYIQRFVEYTIIINLVKFVIPTILLLIFLLKVFGVI